MGLFYLPGVVIDRSTGSKKLMAPVTVKVVPEKHTKKMPAPKAKKVVVQVDRNQAARARLQKKKSSHKVTEKPDGLLPQDSQLFLENFSKQMFNPDAYVKARGELVGVPDDAGTNIWTHEFSTVNTIKVVPDVDGAWWVAVSPDYRSHIHFSGGNVATTPTAGTLTGGRSFVQRGAKNSSSARKVTSYTDPNPTFSINDFQSGKPTVAAASFNPGPDATFPFIMAIGDTSNLPGGGVVGTGATVVSPVHTPSGGFVFRSGPDTIFGASTGTQHHAMSLTISNPVVTPTTAGSDGVYLTLWGGSGPDIKVGTDQCITTIGIIGSTATTASISGSLSLSAYNILYYTVNIVNPSPNTIKTCNLLQFNAGYEFGTLTPIDSLTETSSGFVDPANASVDPDWEAYRHVSTGVLIQDDTAVIEKQGRVAGASLAASDLVLEGFKDISYETISDVVGAYAGKSADGLYGFLLPVNQEDFQEWKAFPVDPNLPNENSLVFAGEGAPGSPSPTFITVRVVSVWQVRTRSRKYGPRRESFVPKGMTAEAMFRFVNGIYSKGPQVMCNPSHEWWGMLYKKLTNGIKMLPAIVSTTAKFAAATATVAADVAPWVAAGVGLLAL